MDPMTYLIFVIAICVLLIVACIVLSVILSKIYSQNKRLSIEKVLFRYKWKAAEIQVKLAKLKEKERRVKRHKLWMGVAKGIFRTVRIACVIFGDLTAIPEIFLDIDLPSLGLEGLLEDFDIPNDYNFEDLSDGFEGVSNLSDEGLVRISLEDLTTYESELDSTLQSLNQILADLES